MPEPVMDGSFIPGTAKRPQPFEFAPPKISNHFGVWTFTCTEDAGAVQASTFADAFLQPLRDPRVHLLANLSSANMALSGLSQTIGVKSSNIGDAQSGIDRDGNEVLQVLATPTVSVFVLSLSVAGFAGFVHSSQLFVGKGNPLLFLIFVAIVFLPNKARRIAINPFV